MRAEEWQMRNWCIFPYVWSLSTHTGGPGEPGVSANWLLSAPVF